jgi:hypothetical protein
MPVGGLIVTGVALTLTDGNEVDVAWIVTVPAGVTGGAV